MSDDSDEEKVQQRGSAEHLMSAIHEGRIDDLVEGLEAMRLVVREEDAKEITKMLFLAAAGDGKTQCMDVMMKSALEPFCDVNACHDNGDSCLIRAAQEDHPNAICFLISSGANIFHRNRFECTALDVACEAGHLKSARILLNHALECKEKNMYSGAGFVRYLYTGLIAATESNQVKVVDLFLNAGVPVNMNASHDIGTPLHYAVECNHMNLVEKFLSGGADVESLRKSHLQTPLMLACQLGHVTVAERLLEAGAEIDRQTEECSSALTLACHFGHKEVVDLLIAHGADVNQKNRWGFNPLFMGGDSPAIMKSLLAAGADPDVPSGERDERPLHLAAVVGSTEAITLLLNAGCNINLRTNENENALWLAAWKGHSEVAKLLIQHNIELDVATNACQVYHWDYLSLEVAIGQGHFDIMMMLLKAGCALTNKIYYSGAESGALSELPWLRLRPEPLALLMDSPEKLEAVKKLLCNPASLKHTCRLQVRRILGVRIKEAKRLEVPRDLVQYLLFHDL